MQVYILVKKCPDGEYEIVKVSKEESDIQFFIKYETPDCDDCEYTTEIYDI